jgi:guanine nucleotide-binding protein subunit alpha
MVAMGSCMSTSGDDQRKRSNKLDKELEEDSKRLRKECKILLLGTSPPVRVRCGALPIALHAY